MRKAYSILYILLSLPVFASCSSTSDNITEIVVNNMEKTDSIIEKKDTIIEKTDSIIEKTDSIVENADSSGETDFPDVDNAPSDEGTNNMDAENTNGETNRTDTGNTNSGGEVLTPQEELPDNIFKLEEYLQLYRGHNYAEGAAVYGDYLFQASLNSEIHIYNFKEKSYITSIKLPSVGHADTLCFGVEKVDENDEFPALYISGAKVYEEGKRGSIYVYRLLREKDEQGTESWSGTLIQNIKTPDVAVVGSYPDIVIDEKENCMWIIGWFQKMGYNVSDGSGCTYIFSKYKTPSITDGTKDKKGVYQLVLSEDNRQSYFLLYDVHAITQGLCFYNGIIICPYGKPAVSYKGIDLVDVNKQQLVANVDLAKSLINEAEAAVVVDGNLYLVGQKSYVYKCIDFNLSALGNY